MRGSYCDAVSKSLIILLLTSLSPCYRQQLQHRICQKLIHLEQQLTFPFSIKECKRLSGLLSLSIVLYHSGHVLHMDLCRDEPGRNTEKLYPGSEDPFGGFVIFVSVHIFPTFITESVLHSGITQSQFPLSHCTLSW